MTNDDDNYKNSPFSFEIIHKDKTSKARVGKVITPHGVIVTPQFIPVGTQATVKSLSAQDLEEVGAQMIFGNTYHLHLRPGEDIVEKFGGLGRFMSWKGSTITDSGGFQVFSLAKGKAYRVKGEEDQVEDVLVKIADDKVTFRSHIDGSLHVFTPEKSIEIQHKLGADFIIAFDQCPPSTASYEEVQQAVGRTHEWLKRCVIYHASNGNTRQMLIGVVQGGQFANLRKESAQFVSTHCPQFIAIGGVSVGEGKEEMRKVLEYTMPYLPEKTYKHLLGVGEIDDIFDIIAQGIDTFDCVIPTRFGRYGIVFARIPEGSKENRFRLDLNKSVYAKDTGPMTKDCLCKVCTTYSRGYVHHLFKANELLGYRLASYHNVYFLLHLVKEIRQAILEDRFEEMRREWIG